MQCDGLLCLEKLFEFSNLFNFRFYNSLWYAQNVVVDSRKKYLWSHCRLVMIFHSIRDSFLERSFTVDCVDFITDMLNFIPFHDRSLNMKVKETNTFLVGTGSKKCSSVLCFLKIRDFRNFGRISDDCLMEVVKIVSI